MKKTTIKLNRRMVRYFTTMFRFHKKKWNQDIRPPYGSCSRGTNSKRLKRAALSNYLVNRTLMCVDRKRNYRHMTLREYIQMRLHKHMNRLGDMTHLNNRASMRNLLCKYIGINMDRYEIIGEFITTIKP